MQINSVIVYIGIYFLGGFLMHTDLKKSTFHDLAKMEKDSQDIVAVKVDGLLEDIQTPVRKYESIEFVSRFSEEGRRIYARSVFFLLVLAVEKLYPKADVLMLFTVNHGFYLELSDMKVSEDVIKQIEEKMREMVLSKLKIARKTLPKEEVVRYFREKNKIAKAEILARIEKNMLNVYILDNVYEYFYGSMASSTESLGDFSLDSYENGMLLRTPCEDKKMPRLIRQPKFSHLQLATKRLAHTLQVEYVADLNRCIKERKIGRFIRIAEALHEKQIAKIADDIREGIAKRRVILIAGPSSSGKTSFTQRLDIELRVSGLDPLTISLDDYFLPRKEMRRLPNGRYDFEALDALDIPLFNEHLLKLLKGEELELPHFNFVDGVREWGRKKPIVLRQNQPILLEGIHALNDKLTRAIARKEKYKIYISALTPLNLDEHNRIPTADARLIRRLVRDFKFRGRSASVTLGQWQDVRRGEEVNIFPFQEEGDAVFNSALLYEIAVLKKYAMPLLQKVEKTDREYYRAQRILDFCVYFEDLEDEEDIPANSLLREFIGGSCFFDEEGNLKKI